MYHSQNNEAEAVVNYFNGRIGHLLDLGANDGKYCSNSYDLIQSGWSADLFEPLIGCYDKIKILYFDDPKVTIHHHGIATKTGIVPFYASNGSVINVVDKQLLNEWGYKVEYETTASLLTWVDAQAILSSKIFNFITIDCEGLDWDILQQMNLRELGCECICIEQGNSPENCKRMKQYCASYGLTRELLYNFENVIFAI